MKAWETYHQELSSRGHGHAVWDADPGEEPAVEIADVGYMKMGAFIRLFNASKEIGDISNRFGTPEGYEPIHIGAMRHGTLSAIQPITSETVRQRRVGVGVSGGLMVQSGGGFSFECTKKQGAALILRQDAHRTDALQEITFTRYVLENHSKWLKFANDVHERGISADQLLMVTGCDKASEWLGAAFLASSNQIGLEFQIGNTGIAQGGISVWGSWDHGQSVEVQAGPSSRVRQTPSSNTLQITNEPETNSHNQCVFLRGYKLCDRPSLRRRMRLIRQKKPLDDGFMQLHQRKGNDKNKPGGSSGSSNNVSSGDSGSSGIWGNAIDHSFGIADHDSVVESSPNNGSQDSLGSSIQSQTDSSSFVDEEQSDDDLSLYQFQGMPELTHLDILIQYILENSSAVHALVHHDDLLPMLQDLTPTSAFEGVLHQVWPHIFINNSVGMLESTFKKSGYAESSNLTTSVPSQNPALASTKALDTNMAALENLGIVANVISVLQLTESIIGMCSTYVTGMKNTPRHAARIVTELVGLHAVLTQVFQLANKETQWTSQLEPGRTSRLLTLNEQLHVCGDEMKHLQTVLDDEMESLEMENLKATLGGSIEVVLGSEMEGLANNPARKGGMQALMWPLKEAKVNKTVDSIRKLKDLLIMAMEVDQTYSMLKIDDSGIEAFQGQGTKLSQSMQDMQNSSQSLQRQTANSQDMDDTTGLLLLEKGADVNAQGGEYGGALQAAASGGHYMIVPSLLEKGTDVNAQGGKYGSALQVAASGGHDRTVLYLLGKGADINAHGGKYGSALQAAASGGHYMTVLFLLAKGAEVNAQGGEYGSALQAAASGGHHKIVLLLLEKGADVNAQGGEYGTALQVAASGGHHRIVLYLLGKGADINAHGGKYGSALQAAASGGHYITVLLLLEKGADVNAQGGEYGTALQVAASGGHHKIVLYLLGKGADINAHGGKYGSALQAAASGGHYMTVLFLLEKGAEVNAQGGEYGNALQAAASGGHHMIVLYLLGKGADVNAHGGKYGSALQAAASRGHDRTVLFLLEKGADVNAQGGAYGGVLQASALGGHNTTLRLLLEKGVEVNPQGGVLQAGASEGHDTTVLLLLEKGTDINAHQ